MTMNQSIKCCCWECWYVHTLDVWNSFFYNTLCMCVCVRVRGHWKLWLIWVTLSILGWCDKEAGISKVPFDLLMAWGRPLEVPVLCSWMSLSEWQYIGVLMTRFSKFFYREFISADHGFSLPGSCIIPWFSQSTN